MANFNFSINVDLEVDDNYLQNWNKGREEYSKQINGDKANYIPYDQVFASILCDRILDMIYDEGNSGHVTYEIN